MIEAPEKMFSADELPPVDPEHPIDEIHQAVLNLHTIAKNLRAQRFSGGALRLDQVGPSLPCIWLFCAICPVSFLHHVHRSMKEMSEREYHAQKLLTQFILVFSTSWLRWENWFDNLYILHLGRLENIHSANLVWAATN